MLCVSVAVGIAKTAMIAYTRVAIVIREKFIGPKILGIEVQGHNHGSFYTKTFNRAEVSLTTF